MNNWTETLPSWWTPYTLEYDEARWPDYADPAFTRALSDTPDALDILAFLNYGQADRRAWGGWTAAFKADKPLAFRPDFHGPVADRLYETARYKFLVPAWRRAIVEVVGELDDIEDQISTILWIMEWITAKVIPIPKVVMNNAQRLQRTLDCAEKIVAGVTPFRFTKHEHTDCLRKIAAGKAGARDRRAGLLGWFRDNWGRLLEAAQATDTWFDVGLVLGPIMGYIEEGMWGLATQTTNNYLIAVDAVMPGYKEDFNRNAAELSAEVDLAWNDTWESLSSWTTDQIERFIPLPNWQH